MIIRIHPRRITRTAWKSINTMRKYFWEFDEMRGTSRDKRQTSDYVCLTFSRDRNFYFDKTQLSEIMDLFNPADWELHIVRSNKTADELELTIKVDNSENLWAVGPNKVAKIHDGAWGMLEED